MDVLIIKNENGCIKLTTNSSASSYGKPILRVEYNNQKGSFGPADIIRWKTKTKETTINPAELLKNITIPEKIDYACGVKACLNCDATLASKIVFYWATWASDKNLIIHNPDRTEDEIRLARNFLSQWPEGDQLPTEERAAR